MDPEKLHKKKSKISGRNYNDKNKAQEGSRRECKSITWKISRAIFQNTNRK